MQYDLIKSSLGNVFNKSTFLRISFYKMLDILLLRTYYIKNEIKSWSKNKNSNIKVLDAGSGYGQYTYYISTLNKNWQIDSIDIKEEQIEDCNNFFSKINHNNVKFNVEDLTLINIKNEYDLVLSVDVMEHILEDVKVFDNLFSSLKPNGMLLISTPSDKGGSEAHNEDDESFIDEHVRNGYNIDEIKNKLNSSGFKDIEAKYSYGKLGHISWLISMKAPIILVNKTKLFFIFLPIYYILLFPFCFLMNYIDANTNHKSGTGLIVKAFKM